MSPAEKVAYATEVEVDRLLRLSAFELEKYSEVETELGKVKERLAHTPSIWPTKGWLSRGFGMKYDPFTGYEQMHRGIDIANRRGTPVMATAAGRVKSVGTFGGLGKMVIVDHGYGFVTRYGHLSQINVKRGQRVDRGEVIALMGNTGYSTGPHLHYEVWRNGKILNPRDFILNEK
jgi:murein DD-endopeptidase MepM/ murein hydrolase activator NlpD